MGLKESGLRGSLRNVSVGIDAIPDQENLQTQYDLVEETGFDDDDPINTLTDFVSDLDADGGTGGTYKSDAFNGNPVARLDDDDDRFEVSGSTDSFNYLHDGSGGTIYFVFANYSLDGNFDDLLQNNNTDTGDVGIQYGESGSNGELRLRITNGGNIVVDESASFSGNILTIVMDSDRTPQYEAYDDDNSIVSTNFNNSPSSANSDADLHFNADTGGGSELGFDFVGALFYDVTHDNDTRQEVWNYLDNRLSIGL